jgi:hypothetical protein
MNRRTASALIVLYTLAGCSGTDPQGDAALDTYTAATCLGGIDPSFDFASAVALKEGDTVNGAVCPRNDRDFYQITVPAGRQLLNLKLVHAVAMTNLQLTYTLFDAKQKLVGAAPAWTWGGVRSFDVIHCLSPGTYYLMVHDDGNDDYDRFNDYTISYLTQADPDTNEPNDSVKGASAPGSPAYIACAGDVDNYKLQVTQTGKLLQVALSTADITPVDLRYTIYDPSGKQIAQKSAADGGKAATKLEAVHAAPTKGTYIIAVDDLGGDDSDTKRSYTLSAKLIDDPDPNELTTRNDTAGAATKLGSFSCTDPPKTIKLTGAIASFADVDWYRLDVGACADLVVLEVSVDYKGSSAVDPQVSLIYPDAKACSKDACCKVLSTYCSDFTDCLRITPTCVNKGDAFCNDATCEAKPSLFCPTERRCAGASVCLPGGTCGAEQVTRVDTSGSDKAGASVKTAQPVLHAGANYIRVSDYRSDDNDSGKTYEIVVRVRVDPDKGRELDSEYFADKPHKSVQIDTLSYHLKQAKKQANKIKFNTWVSGYLSYEGDQDWFILEGWPCGASAGWCALKASFEYTGSGCPKGSKDTDGDPKGLIDDGLELVFAMHYENGKYKAAFPATPTTGKSGTFGAPDACFIARDCAGLTGVTLCNETGYKTTKSYLFSVTDLLHNMWSWSCGYRFKIDFVSDSCPSPCVLHSTEKFCYSQ